MDVYIKESGGGRLALSMPPEEIKCTFGTNFQSYTIINGGDVQIPKGEVLSSFSWEGTLPGASRKKASYVRKQHWRSPNEILNMWDRWRKKGIRLKLMVTETAINHDVFLDTYDADYSGGNGDCKYSISFVLAKKMEIRTVGELGMQPETASGDTGVDDVRASSDGAESKTYTVKAGDCLWSIAQQCLGAGSRYGEIYDLNKSEIDAKNSGTGNPKYTIYPGQVFTLPG